MEDPAWGQVLELEAVVDQQPTTEDMRWQAQAPLMEGSERRTNVVVVGDMALARSGDEAPLHTGPVGSLLRWMTTGHNAMIAHSEQKLRHALQKKGHSFSLPHSCSLFAAQ
jgi:hypothetical protein